MKAAPRIILLTALSLLMLSSVQAEKLKALIIDGQNNHTVWPKSTFMMKDYLEETGKFEVDISRLHYLWKSERWLPEYPLNDGIDYEAVENPITDPNYEPDFSGYDVIISNFGWRAASWPDATQKALEKYMENGGGFVSVHAADNCFPEWNAYNRMIGIGGWGGRNEKDGPYVYYNDENELIRDTSKGPGGGHGPQFEITIDVREPNHPITKGMPAKWLHTKDECYDKLRGPANNMTVLATAYSPQSKGKNGSVRGTGRHEPILMVIDYGKGRVFHTTLGHEDYSFEGVGFITSFLRGTEWAASGEVTIPIPEDFPSETEATSRPYQKKTQHKKSKCCGGH